MDAQQSASTLGEENKRLLEARRREQERWEEERAQSKHIVQEMDAEVGFLDHVIFFDKISCHKFRFINLHKSCTKGHNLGRVNSDSSLPFGRDFTQPSII